MQLPKLEAELAETQTKWTDLQNEHYLLERKYQNFQIDFSNTKEELQNAKE